MPKGKKFNAAEKHFLEKEKQWKNRISDLEMQQSNTLKLLNDTEEQLQSLQMKNNELQQWINRLLEYTELSESDIKKAVERDKSLADMSMILGQYTKVLNF